MGAFIDKILVSAVRILVIVLDISLHQQALGGTKVQRGIVTDAKPVR